ncbi:type II secretion system protein [Candidatus Microgenomates bacterium]|nr:type II secretion system protein [Candidatus Microgenomates bacterium]
MVEKFKIIQRGFTLIELLIVIGIIGVLAGVVLVGIDPVDKINAANDTKVQRDINALANAVESYAATNNGSYFGPGGAAVTQADLVSTGNLKVVLAPPTGYSCANYSITSTASTAQASCPLKSKKYTSVATADTWVWCSSSGKAGATADATTCP